MVPHKFNGNHRTSSIVKRPKDEPFPCNLIGGREVFIFHGATYIRGKIRLVWQDTHIAKLGKLEEDSHGAEDIAEVMAITIVMCIVVFVLFS